MTTLLLTTVIVSAAMVMLGVGVILGRKRPLRASCHSAVDDPCDSCRCDR